MATEDFRAALAQAEPVEVAKRQCTATNRQGERCKRYPIPGGTVCTNHGGGAPQVKRRAQQRLLDAIDPAISVLIEEMHSAAKSADRQKAANSILDRAGIPRVVKETDSDTAREHLLERLRENRRTITSGAVTDEVHEVVRAIEYRTPRPAEAGDTEDGPSYWDNEDED